MCKIRSALRPWAGFLTVLATVGLCGLAYLYFGEKSSINTSGQEPAPPLRMTLAAEESLQSAVRNRPPVPVVFTSRTGASSFQPWANEGEGFTYPGSISWTETEGRLRLLHPDGSVYELTWNRPLPDGSTLIDVMSPTVSLDGSRILFAGRKDSPDPGHWRIYSVNVDGSGLQQLTGLASDPGCLSLPPLRFGLNGSKLADAERRQIDFDDVDPIDLGGGSIAFASSRIPDLGRDHSRRSTQIWVWQAGMSRPNPISANRNNDRWPYLLPATNLVYSLWSRNRDAVTQDRRELQPVVEGETYATALNDRWMGARVTANGATFAYAVKTEEPVWRARPLFNGQMSFMTRLPANPKQFRLAQAKWGTISSSPTSQKAGEAFIYGGGSKVIFGPERDANGSVLTAGCPSPCPGGLVLFAAAPVDSAANHALYSVSDDWSNEPVPQILFDDPRLTDSEPVAVYARNIEAVTEYPDSPVVDENRKQANIPLASGTVYNGPAGYLENLAVNEAIRSPIPWQSAEVAPGVRRDPRKNPLIPPPDVKSLVFYVDHRDRFDDPSTPRIRGGWEKQLQVPVNNTQLQAWVPADALLSTKLVGLDASGKIALTTGTTPGANGKPGTYYAVAGDHTSSFRPNGYHYCNGCHTGHTFTSLDIRERLK